jgi:hypothetical protein
MRNVQHLLSLYLITALSSCATTEGACATPSVQQRPIVATCIANKDGTGGCYDPRHKPPGYSAPTLKNYVCIPASDNQAQEEWIESLKAAANQ